MHDRDQHHRHGPGEVQCPRRLRQDLLGVTQVRVDVVGGAFRAAGQQRPGVAEHDRVVVHVHDPAVSCHRLGHLVSVAGGRDPGADVKELADPLLPGQVAHRAGQERAVGPDRVDNVRISLDCLIACLPVGCVVVLAAQPVVIHPGDVRDAGVERRVLALAGGHITRRFACCRWAFARHWRPFLPCGQLHAYCSAGLARVWR